MAKKSVFAGGAQQVYERCVGPACENKDTPARKLIALTSINSEGSDVSFHPLCVNCESTAKQNAVKRGLAAPKSLPLTKERMYQYRESLESEVPAAKKSGLSKEIVNPDPHGAMEHLWFSQENRPTEPTKRKVGETSGARPGQKANKELDELTKQSAKEQIGGRPLLQRGVKKKQKRLTPAQQEAQIAYEKDRAEASSIAGPYTELSPRKTKSGKVTRRSKDRTNWIAPEIDKTRRPTKRGTAISSNPQTIMKVKEARVRAADPKRLLGNPFIGKQSGQIVLETGKKMSLEDYKANLEAAVNDRATESFNVKREKRGKKKK
jgi:hypothetical protein